MLVSFLTNHFSLEGGAFFAVFIAGILLCMVIPYLFGSLNFAIIISKLFYHDDIRKYGSGNAGTTNMLRTYGKLPAAATLLLDMSKGAVSVLFGLLILGDGVGKMVGDSAVISMGGTYLAGLFAVLGHMFPCFYRFKGGKGVATTAVVVLCTNPIVFCILLLVFLVIVIGTKMISLGSVMCMLVYPLLLSRFAPTQPEGVLISFLIAALVIFMHRSNIKRIWEGKESKISFKKHQKTPAASEVTKAAPTEEATESTEETSAPKSNTPDKNTSKKKLKKQKNHNK